MISSSSDVMITRYREGGQVGKLDIVTGVPTTEDIEDTIDLDHSMLESQW